MLYSPRNHTRPWALALAAAMVLSVLFAAPAFADDTQWNRNKGDCEFVLKAPDRYPLPSIEECTMLWEQYKDVSSLSPDEKKLFARGFSWLFIYGAGNQKAVARGALGRIGKPKPLILDGGVWKDPNIGETVDTQAQSDARVNDFIKPRAKVTPRKAARRAEAKAKQLVKQGLRLHNRGKHGQALSKYKSALQSDPFNVDAKYNMACALALLGDSEGALDSLLTLQSWDSGLASAKFRKARADEDFRNIHNDARFRRLVGLVRIQLLNGAEEPGLFHVGRIRKDLMSRGFYIAQYGFDRHIRKRPLVYYREGYEAQAAQIKDIVANIRTATLPIKWDSPFDLIVVWGDPDVAAQAGVSGPLVQGEEVKDRGDATGEFINKFNDAKGTAEDLNKAATEVPDLPR